MKLGAFFFWILFVGVCCFVEAVNIFINAKYYCPIDSPFTIDCIGADPYSGDFQTYTSYLLMIIAVGCFAGAFRFLYVSNKPETACDILTLKEMTSETE